MKISVDGQDLFELSEIQKKVIKNDIHEDIFEDDMKRRLQWILVDQKYNKCLERLKSEWMPKLMDRYQSIPTKDEELAELILSQHDYECRATRERKSMEESQGDAK